MPFSKFQPCGEHAVFSPNILHFCKKIFLSEEYLARACSFIVDCWGFSRSLLRIQSHWVERIPRVSMLSEAMKYPDYIIWYKSRLG